MDILLANDTGIVAHHGCQGVSDAHARLLGRRGHHVKYRYFVGDLARHASPRDADIVDSMLSDDGLVNAISNCDAIVVNGEGTIHHGAGRDLLALLAIGQRFSKPTFLVNAVFQEVECFDEVLRRLDDFTVRDQASFDYAKSKGLECRIVPDSFLAAEFSGRPLLDLKGKIVVTDWHAARHSDVGTICAQLMAELERAFFLPFETSDAYEVWQDLPATVRACDVLVTARHHGVYLGILSQIPFLALGSNTHKVEGLLDLLGLRHLFCTSLAEVERALAWALDNRAIFPNLLDRLTNSQPLTTFDRLGVGNRAGNEAAEIDRLSNDIAAHSSRRRSSYRVWQTSDIVLAVARQSRRGVSLI